MNDFLDKYREKRGKPINVKALVKAIQTINQIQAMFAGKKTYILGTIAIITAVGTYLAGVISIGEAATAIFAAVQSMNLRSGITTEAKKAAQ